MTAPCVRESDLADSWPLSIVGQATIAIERDKRLFGIVFERLDVPLLEPLVDDGGI